MSSPRKKALFKAVNTAPVIPTSADEIGRSAEDIFGRYVFGLATMRKRLPKDVFKKLAKTIRDGERLNPEIADVVANAMFNSDGSEAEMCGNAIRCVGKYVHDHGILSKDVIRVETRAGEKIVRLLFEGGEVCGATVDMGEPVLTPANIPVLVEGDTSAQRFVARPVEVDGAGYDITAVSMRGPLPEIFVAEEPRDALYKPSANVLFETAGKAMGRRTLGAILTGMGSDGCEGAKVLKEKGGCLIAQNEASCVVYGMPKAIVDNKLANLILDVDDIANAIITTVRG